MFDSSEIQALSLIIEQVKSFHSIWLNPEVKPEWKFLYRLKISMSDIPQQSLIEDAPDWLKASAMQSDVIDVSFPTLLLVVFLTKLSTIW